MKSASKDCRRTCISTPRILRVRHPLSSSALSRRVLLGMVPVLTPAPPRTPEDSMRATLFPNLPAANAPLVPAGPPPRTIRSKFFTSIHAVMRDRIAQLLRVHFVDIKRRTGFPRPLRIGGTATIPKTSDALVVLILSMDLVDRDYSIRAMTNRAALSHGIRICQRMGRSGRGD